MRRDHESGEGMKGLARKYRVYRRMVREALTGPLPNDRKKPQRISPQIGAYASWIEATLRH